MNMNFGTYKDKRPLEWIFFNDPDYICWMLKKNAQNSLLPALQSKFNDLVRRASHLKVPCKCQHCGQNEVTTMWVTKHPSGGLARIDFLCSSCTMDCSGSYPTKPSFLEADAFKSYDILGGEILVQAIKYAYYGNLKERMTEQKAEAFFNNPRVCQDFCAFPLE